MSGGVYVALCLGDTPGPTYAHDPMARAMRACGRVGRGVRVGRDVCARPQVVDTARLGPYAAAGAALSACWPGTRNLR